MRVLPSFAVSLVTCPLLQLSLNSQTSDPGLSEECATLRLHKTRLENEISRLHNQLKAAEAANVKWQVRRKLDSCG